MWTVHIVALVVFFLLTIGFFSRTMAVLAFLFAVSYANRITPGAYFGLDKINCMLAMYLMLGPCGARYSIDRLWRLRAGRHGSAAQLDGQPRHSPDPGPHVHHLPVLGHRKLQGEPLGDRRGQSGFRSPCSNTSRST